MTRFPVRASIVKGMKFKGGWQKEVRPVQLQPSERGRSRVLRPLPEAPVEWSICQEDLGKVSHEVPQSGTRQLSEYISSEKLSRGGCQSQVKAFKKPL